MKKYLTTSFAHATDNSLQVDIETVLTMDSALFINSLSSSLSQEQFANKLDEEEIEYAVYERPKRRPTN